jgi:hypothetical protein
MEGGKDERLTKIKPFCVSHNSRFDKAPGVVDRPLKQIYEARLIFNK